VVAEEKDWIGTTTDYGVSFVSSIWKDQLFATQFHPEKSQEKGLRILEAFAKSL
jgi:glutamine amidotransferase